MLLFTFVLLERFKEMANGYSQKAPFNFILRNATTFQIRFIEE